VAESRFEPTAELVGSWSGMVSADGRQIPVVLSFSSSGKVEARVELGPMTPIGQPNLDGHLFTGRSEGNWKTPDARRSPITSSGR
jgi:hypothetical protein